MRPRLLLVSAFLLLSILACNLGNPPDNLPPTPTLVDTATLQVVLLPTNTNVVATPIALQPTVGCTPRTDWPTITVVSGDTLFGIAQRVGSTVNDLVAANCLTNAATIFTGQTLRVPTVPIASSGLGATQTAACRGQGWFFTFSPGKQETHCPGPVVTTRAVGENFEGGRVYWYQAPPASQDTRGTIYVIYNDGDWETYVDIFVDGQLESDPNIVPPAGRYQPVRGIGKVWRDHPDVRSRLGWAYEPESVFAGRRQEAVGDVGIPFYSYIDHGWNRLVLRLYSVDMAPNRWEVVGMY